MHRRRCLGRPPPQQGPHPGPQHRQGKGLGDVVIRPGFQPGDLVQFQVVGGQQNHRRPVSRPPQLPQQCKTTAVRQVDIQNQQVKVFPGQHCSALPQCARQGDRAPRRFQGHPDPPPQGRVVLQQKDGFHALLPFPIGFALV